MNVRAFGAFRRRSGLSGFPPEILVARVVSRGRASRLGRAIVGLAAACWAIQVLRAHDDALVTRHGAAISGTVEGSIVVLDEAANVSVAKGALVTGDLVLPTDKASKSEKGKTKSSKTVVSLGDSRGLKGKQKANEGFNLPKVESPKKGGGTDAVDLQTPSGGAPDFKKVKDIKVNNDKRTLVVPPGSYGDVDVEKGTLVLGVKGSLSPARYNFQSITINGGAQVSLNGPVVITVGQLGRIQGIIGNAQFPTWCDLRVTGGDVTLEGTAELHAVLTATTSAVTVSKGGKVRGGIVCDQATVESTAKVTAVAPNWTKESSGDSAPLFIHKALRVERRLPELTSRFGHGFTPAVIYSNDVPTIMLSNEIVVGHRFAQEQGREAFFAACCALFDGTGFAHGNIVVVTQATPPQAPQALNVSLSREQFEENLAAVGHQKERRDNIARIRSDPLMLNIFMTRAVTLARNDRGGS